jgi:hypothetical protein
VKGGAGWIWQKKETNRKEHKYEKDICHLPYLCCPPPLFAVLGFELMASFLLGRHSTT